MSHANRTADNAAPLFHPISHYDTPEDVLHDTKLSSAEKRVILSSWASDMYAVESQPALRKIPGIAGKLRLDDILAALRQLDEDTDPPPRGGMAMRLPHLSKIDCTGSAESQVFIGKSTGIRRPPPIIVSRASRWSREANVRRYRRLLKTQLTDLERSYVERRLAQELGGDRRQTKGRLRDRTVKTVNG